MSSILLFLSAILVPMYFTDFRLHLGGLILRLADVISFSVIAFFVICKRHGVVELYLPKGYAYLSLFLIYCFINAMWQSGLFKAIVATFQWAMILATLAIVYSHSVMYPEKFKELFIKALLAICFVVVLYHFSIGKFVHYKSLGDAKYALALTGVIILTYSYIYQDKRYLLALCILYPFILFSLERKGILAFHVVLIIYLCASMKSLFQIGLLSVFAIFLVLLLVNPNVFDYSAFSIFEYSDYEMLDLDEEQAKWVSNYHRQSLIENGWDILKQNSIFGIGPKMLTFSMLDYYYNPDLALYTHNVFLDTLIEQGITGLLLLLLPYFIYLSAGGLKSSRQTVCFIALSIYSGIMLFFMSGGAPSMVLMYLPLLTSYMFSNKKLVS
jgi:hypothetical protein